MKKILLNIGIIIVAIAIIFVGVRLIQSKTYNVQKPIATIQIQGYEKPIKIELDPQSAPNAVSNFIKLANSGFYSNFKMHIENDRILGDESMEMARVSNIMEYPQQDYVYGIKGDFLANGFENLIKHKKGVITMERDDYSILGYYKESYNSANCNFAILTEDKENYNGNYASFGHIVEGIDVLDAIAATRVEEKQENGENKENSEVTSEAENVNVITITSITVDTFGVDYGVPEFVNYEETTSEARRQYNQIFGGNNSNIVME